MTDIPLKTEDSLFTDQQWEAIHTSGSNLLISASAGSGKTMVLVNRIIEKIKKGVGVDELLVVTFTNAAAREMKQRIQQALQDEINADPDFTTRTHLVQQLPKLGHANISTLHSFCLKVIERYYYLIDFDPVFRLLTDDTEIELIKEDVWNELLEELYEQGDSTFINFMEAYSGARNDDEVTRMVFGLHEFSRANIQPKEWLHSLTALYETPASKRLSDTRIYQDYFKQNQLNDIRYCIQLLEQALTLANDEAALENQINILTAEKTHYERVRSLLEADELENCYELMSQGYAYDPLRAPGKKTTPEEVLEIFHDEIKHLRNEAKKAFQKFEGNYVLSPSEQLELISQTKTYVEVLADITEEFSKRYQEYKAERKLIDFNDLEHLTLRILKGEEKAAEKNETSEAAQYYKDKFQEVLVDEYQDINALQEEILLLVSRADEQVGNYFMVGDVKQSIYGFRLADPNLFLEKYEAYAENKAGKRIILAENFRSRHNVLCFTNFIFTQLMDQELGNLAYDKNAELVYGNEDFKKDDAYQTEILIYEKGKEEASVIDELDLEDEAGLQISHKTTGEILMTASKIEELITGGFEIYDKKADKMRPLEYRDIVLLTPTKKNNLEIQELLQEVGIPTAINETQNFFQTTEVTIMMSLLKIIDNPRQDIPLVAVLRSPIIGLNEVELTYIRLQDRQADFYEATCAYAEAEFVDAKNLRLQKRIQHFLKDLDRWREYARRRSVVDLIRYLYQETGYLHYVGGMNGGKQRKANLEALYHRAAAYEKTSFKGLYRFIRFIDKMQEKDKDLAEPASILAEQNAVRVMTIHASKGLEFPLVFLMDMSKEFNKSDWTGDYLFDRDLGVGLKYKDPTEQIKAQTLVEAVIKQLKKENGYAEQMRLLYVALTRAEQKLFLVGTMEAKEKAFEKWDKGNSDDAHILSTSLRLSTNNFMDWIGLAIARHQTTQNEVYSRQINQTIKQYPVTFSIQFYDEEKITTSLADAEAEEKISWLKQLPTKEVPIKLNAETKVAVQEALAIIEYDYPYQLSTQTTNYQSVSEVKQLFDEPDDGQLAKIDWTEDRQVKRYSRHTFERPLFLQERTPPTPTEIGQGTHLLLQTLDLTQAITAEHITTTLGEMTQAGVIQEEVASKINISEIITYFQTPFGQEILAHGAAVKKEVLFSLLIDAKEVFVGMEEVDDSILIHGIIDGYFERTDGLVLFDYKTDRVKHLGAQAEAELLKRYRGQLKLYKQALATITKKEVIEMGIISLDLNKTIIVK